MAPEFSRTRKPPRGTRRRPKAVPEKSVSPARHLEELLESLLAQRIYAVEFAWGFTLVTEHLALARRRLGELDSCRNAEERHVLTLARHGLEHLDRAVQAVRRFVEEKDLGSLDRGLALARLARFPLEEAVAAGRLMQGRLQSLEEVLWLDPAPPRSWEDAFEARVQRHHGETRATFRCKRCGWEFTYTQENPGSEQVELPLSGLECPLCEGAVP